MLFTSDSDDDFIKEDYVKVTKKYRTVTLQDGSRHNLPVVNKMALEFLNKRRSDNATTESTVNSDNVEATTSRDMSNYATPHSFDNDLSIREMCKITSNIKDISLHHKI